jgi:hypothetical protein
MVIVGTADEMKAVVKSVRRAYNRYATDWYTSHCSMPKFNPTKGYAIIFDEDDKAMYVKPIDIALVENVERG